MLSFGDRADRLEAAGNTVHGSPCGDPLEDFEAAELWSRMGLIPVTGVEDIGDPAHVGLGGQSRGKLAGDHEHGGRICLLAIIWKRIFLNIGRHGIVSQAPKLDAQVFEVALEGLTVEQFFDDGLEVGQGADFGQGRHIRWPTGAAETGQQTRRFHRDQRDTTFEQERAWR